MTPIRASLIAGACTAMTVAAGQAPSDPPRFRVAVDVVSIDAVVTDRSGEVVRDLTAADFEVFQNGKRQKVTFAQFVPVTPVDRAAAGATARGAITAPAATPVPPPATPIAREQVRRTIVLVVDDLGGVSMTRRGLRGFVDTALLPTDLAAIVRTAEARGLRQPLPAAS